MNILSVVSLKGGAGRTTIAASLACEAARCGRSVLLIGSDEEAGGIGFLSRLNTSQGLTIRTIDFDGLDKVISAAQYERFDVVIIDCPRSREWTVAAILNADLVVVPTQPAIFDLRGTIDTLELLKAFGKPHSLVLNLCDRRSQELLQVENMAIERGWPLAPVLIHKDKMVPRAFAEGLPVAGVWPAAATAREYAALWRYVEVLLTVREKQAA